MVEKDFFKELNKPFYINQGPSTSINKLDKTVGIKILWIGRRPVGVRRVLLKESNKAIEQTQYKITARMIEFNNGLKIKVESFIFRELKKRYRLNVKYCNYYG